MYTMVSQNKSHEEERPVLWTNPLLLQPLHPLWLNSAYTPVYSLKPRPILHHVHSIRRESSKNKRGTHYLTWQMKMNVEQMVDYNTHHQRGQARMSDRKRRNTKLHWD